jgi:formate hydrogenlyase subunit 6/NADH:ubiquinone oxidoreductase subunit I
MFKVLKLGRFKKGLITTDYPKVSFTPCEPYNGMPVIDSITCTRIGECARACPTAAITVNSARVAIDLGSCIFCGACERACPKGAIKLSSTYELTTKVKDHLKVEY